MIDPLSLVLRLRARFYPIFGSNWTQIGPKFFVLQIPVTHSQCPKVFRHEIGTAQSGEKSLRELLGAASESNLFQPNRELDKII